MEEHTHTIHKKNSSSYCVCLFEKCSILDYGSRIEWKKTTKSSRGALMVARMCVFVAYQMLLFVFAPSLYEATNFCHFKNSTLDGIRVVPKLKK